MFRSLILTVATIGAIAIGSAAPANAYVPCSPYVGGMCGQDTEVGLGAFLYRNVFVGLNRPYGGGGYNGYNGAYGYQPRPVYRQPQAWCVGRDAYGNVVSRTPGPCGNGY